MELTLCTNIVLVVLNLFLRNFSGLPEVLQCEDKIVILGGDFNINFMVRSFMRQQISDLCAASSNLPIFIGQFVNPPVWVLIPNHV